jgi:hypothetical protein
MISPLNSPLKSDLPASIQSFGELCFQGCQLLPPFMFELGSTHPEIETYVMDQCLQLNALVFPLHFQALVPAVSVSAILCGQ